MLLADSSFYKIKKRVSILSGPSEVGGLGAGGLQPLNNLQKFVDFVSEKGCKSQGRRNEDSKSYIFDEATRIYQKCNIF